VDDLRYVYDGQEILLEYGLDSVGANRLLARYTHSTLGTDDVLAVDIKSDGQLAGLAQVTGSYQYLKDVQGTITDIADTEGNKVQHYAYSAYGQLLAVKDAAGVDVTESPLVRTSYSYTGREYDSESGYYYYRARYYDPAVGRFLQKDPKPGKLSTPLSVINSFNYAANNPVNVLDPSGQGWWSSWGRSLAIGIGIGIAAGLTGGLAGGLLGASLASSLGISAAAGGAIVGAITGAIVGGGLRAAWNGLEGRSWSDNVAMFAISGAISGGLAGATAASKAVATRAPASSGVGQQSNVTRSGYDPTNDPFSEIKRLENFSNDGLAITNETFKSGTGIAGISAGVATCNIWREILDDDPPSTVNVMAGASYMFFCESPLPVF